MRFLLTCNHHIHMQQDAILYFRAYGQKAKTNVLEVTALALDLTACCSQISLIAKFRLVVCRHVFRQNTNWHQWNLWVSKLNLERIKCHNYIALQGHLREYRFESVLKDILFPSLEINGHWGRPLPQEFPLIDYNLFGKREDYHHSNC